MIQKSKYNSLNEWRKKNLNAYNFALKNNFISNICYTFGWENTAYKNSVTKGFWQIKENCIIAATKYNSLKEFKKFNVSAYNSSVKNKWLDECCKHMNITKNGHWQIKDNCLKAAKECVSINEFRKKHNSAFNSVRKNNWADECYKHMTPKKTKSYGYWNKKDNCIKEALKCKTTDEFRKKNLLAYKSCCKNKWLEEVNKYMMCKFKKFEYWEIKDNCIIAAKECVSINEFIKKYNSAYKHICKNDWREECFKHIGEVKKKKGYWTKEKCKNEALKYKSRTEFKKENRFVYNCSCKNKWMDEFFATP